MSVKSANRASGLRGVRRRPAAGCCGWPAEGSWRGGVTYVLIGVLAVQIRLGAGGKEADRSDALHAIAAPPVLWLLVAGFAGMALCRFALPS